MGPSNSTALPVAKASVGSHLAHPQGLAPEPLLRLRPRRAWLPRPPEAEHVCGWFDSSRELREGLEVIEWDGAWPGPADLGGVLLLPA